MTQSSFPLIPAADVQVRDADPVLRAIEIIDRSDARIALVVDGLGKLVGSVTDGDVRRGLLKGCTLQSPVREVMHANPSTMPATNSRQKILDAMHKAEVKQMPLVAEDGTLVGIANYDQLTGFVRTQRPNRVVIMAGGKGKRLLPITQDIPKPMVEVAGKPMLEHIIVHFTRQGFTQFDIAVNYLSHVIEDYFGDGKKWQCSINYIREKEFLGTAGALSLIGAPDEPVIVINGDIMTTVDFCGLIDYHISCGSAATVCARAHRVEVPFGLIQMKDNMMQAIVEKPVYEDLVSAGIYVLSPAALKHVPKNQVTDMPTLLQSLVKANCKVAVFPLHEDWTDVGRPDDLAQLQRTFKS